MRTILTKTFLLAVLFTCSLQGRSQVLMSLLFGDKLNSDKLLFGLQLDYGVNTITGLPEESKYLNRFNLGIFLCFRLGGGFYLQAEGLAKYSTGAAGLKPYATGDSLLDQKFANGGAVERRINYLAMPVTLQYRFFNYFNIELGIQPSICIGSKDIFTVGGEDNELINKRDSRDKISNLDFNILGGLNYQFDHGRAMKLGVRYCYGMADVLVEQPGMQANQSIQFYTSIPIGRKKKNQ